MSFWRQISPRRAVTDFAAEWRQPNPYRWRVLGASVAATFVLMLLVIPKSQRAEPRPPEVTWITTFRPDRTDDEIIASNIENQKRKDKEKAEAEARELRRRENAKALGRAMGFDVEQLERDYGDDPSPTPSASERARTTGER
jgi:hypothetical protein